ncbi:hypothetical protein SEA_WATERMOORE_195 [Streptomyces phage Watermoore]|nr:hypothetical protein SEA_WATERMOORE_195 [Streptomyces phage Watermoore]
MTKSLCESPISQVSVSPVKIGFTETSEVRMGEEAFRCSSCQYQFPYHSDDCPYNMNNQK